MADSAAGQGGQAGQAGQPDRTRSPRTIADAPSLTALAHPTRLALLEAIGLSGALTATQASKALGESPTACAYHLRTLARLGFVEEAAGGRGRERPWQLAQAGLSVSDAGGDPAAGRAARALTTLLTERFIGRIRAFELASSRYPQEVQEVTGTMESVIFATPAELAELRAGIFALMTRFTERIDPARRPPGSRPFEMVLFTHVLEVIRQGAGRAQADADT